MTLLLIIAKRLKYRLRHELDQARAIANIQGSNFRIHPTAHIYLEEGTLKIGAGTSIGASTILHLGTGPGPKLSVPEIRIGEGVYIGEACNIRAASGTITIGKNSLIAAHVSMAGTNHGIELGQTIKTQPWPQGKKDVIIGEDVWIGGGAILLPGTRIGDGAVVAAGAVVRGVVAPNTIVGGVPARLIGSRKSS